MLTSPKLIDPFHVVRMCPPSLRTGTLVSGSGGGLLPPAPPLTENAPRAEVAAVRAHARHLDHVARVRSVDELAAADVDAHVAEAVEEDEIARLQLVARDRNADVPQR